MPSPRLSILIPALGSLDALESTLVSVLENRPNDCEIVVALACPYDDPYQLAGEVRFVKVAATSIAGALDEAVQLCRGPIVHVLAAGVEVDEGWTAAALEHFCDDRIAAVAPLVLRSREEPVVCSAGVDYTPGGRRLRRGCGAPHAAYAEGEDVLAPSAVAAFYRRDALLKLPRAFEPAVTDRLFDVDTALQLYAAGYRSVYEPRSVVYRAGAAGSQVAPLAAGRGAERLFWRNAPTSGWLRSLVAHPFAIAAELFDSTPVGGKLARLVGRIIALPEILSYRRHHRELRAVGTPGLTCVVTSTGDRVRFDEPHPHTANANGVAAGVERRER